MTSTRLALSSTALFGTLAFHPLPASAQCAVAPTIGNNNYVCSSGSSGGSLIDNDGNNTLLFTEGGTGTIDGNVTFGGGVDRIEMNSGTITGAVNQGDGDDSFVINEGTVIGNVQQGSGVDDFVMNGGVIQSLNQGDNRDTFRMTGGRIIDAFDDGDVAVMTGGRIGRVNMKLDNNIFDMSGGTIDRNLVAGFGNDTIIVSGGFIGGNVSVSGGVDDVTVTGGSIAGNVLLSVGNDRFTWDGGGIIYGAVDLGGDNDTASLSNLTDANIGATGQITGGLGVDALSFNNVKTGNVSRFDSWETINLTNDTRLVFDGTMVLGDSGTGTGSLSVDAASTIFAGSANGGVSAFGAGQLANVFNSGRIDLTNGSDSVSDTFTIGGNYVGDNGLIFLNTVLEDDASASDKLVIDGGTASGTTGVSVVNTGGGGAETTQSGILVIEALNGGSTASGAFALTNRVAAGAFEYLLFRGGVSGGTEENWYLRSTLVTPTDVPPPEVAPAQSPLVPEPPAPIPQDEPEEVAPPPPLTQPVQPLPVDPDDPDPEDTSPPVEATEPPPVAPPAPPPPEAAEPPPPPPEVPTLAPPVPGAGSPPPTPGATAVVAEIVPLYRVEVPTFAVVPVAAHHLALSSLGTFHERRGDQLLLQQGADYLPSSWGRVFGQDTSTKWDGTVAPSFDGSLYGFQVGQDLVEWAEADDDINRLGVFIGNSQMKGTVRGQALGWNDLTVGDLALGGTSFGGYWTRIAPQGWYLDGVLMGTWFDGRASAVSGQSIDIGGTGITASLEGGYPIALSDQWTLEPQGQLIWQQLSFRDRADAFSTVSFDRSDAWTGRIGARLQGDFQTEMGRIQPYLKANIWHNFSSDQTVRFDATPIVSNIGGTSLEVGAGIVLKATEAVSFYATADYTTNLGGQRRETVEGNIGLRIKW